MLFRIAEENKQRAAHAFTVERIAHDYGYKKSAMLYPKSNRIMHYYEIDMLDADRIICTVRHKNTDCIVALVWLSGYTPESIEVDQAELYRNCSNYPYRREYNEKYLKKYDQIACIVHGAIAAGLLFDTVEAPTEEETSTTAQDTACTDTEPQEGTETAQKTTDMATFRAAFRAAYTDLYDHCGEPETDERERYYCILFDANMDDLQPILSAFAAYRGDLVTSDRASAAFMIALETVGTPTTPQNAPQGTESTTGDQTPTDDTKTPYSATDGTTPASDPRQPDGATTGDTDGGNRITYGATPPRTTCENAPQGAETGASRTSTHPATKNAVQGKIQSRPKPPAGTQKNLCENQGSFRRIVFHRSRIGEVIHIGAFRSEKLTDFRTDSVGEKSPPPRGYQKLLR